VLEQEGKCRSVAIGKTDHRLVNGSPQIGIHAAHYHPTSVHALGATPSSPRLAVRQVP
jgi:hypothetical protein